MQRQPTASQPAPPSIRRSILHNSNRLPFNTGLNYAVGCQEHRTLVHSFLSTLSLPTTSRFTPRSSPSVVQCALPSFPCSFSQSFSLFNIFPCLPDPFTLFGAVKVLYSFNTNSCGLRTTLPSSRSSLHSHTHTVLEINQEQKTTS